MPIVRLYPIGEVSPQPLPNVAPNVPAAGDIAMFGGNRARDLQVAGQNLGQASDMLFALYQRHAQEANDTRVQDLNNRFLDRARAALNTGPDAYYRLQGADAIRGADAATATLTALRDETLGQTVNPYQRERLAPILDAHLAAATTGIMRHTAEQQAVYARGVAANAVETSRAQAIADPSMMANAVMRAEGAARVLHAGQPPEAIDAGARAAGSSVIASVIADRLARNDPMGIALFRRHAERLDPGIRRTLGAAADTLSNTLDAAAWLRDCSATLQTTPSTHESSPVIPPAGTLLDQEGIVGTRERLEEIENRRRALTTLNQQDFASKPVRLRANQAAIDADTARSRAAVKADTDTLYSDLRRHLTTGGPNGGPAITPPPVTIMNRLTDVQQDAVTAQINGAIEGRKPSTDPQAWYAIHQGLTSDDADERQRWASKNLTQYMGQLSSDDLASLEKLQASVRTNDGGAEQTRLQNITRMANEALRSVGIDSTPRPDAAPDSDAAQSATFHRSLPGELAAFESKGSKPTEAETYYIVDGLADTGIKSGWLKVSDQLGSSTDASGGSEDSAQWADANIVRVAGGDKEKEDMRRRLPGSASRPRLGRPDNEIPRPKQIDPLAMPGIGGGGFRAPRPSPGTERVAPKPGTSSNPATGQTTGSVIQTNRAPFILSGPRTDAPTPSEIAENERVGRQIAGGHASLKHMFDEFPDMRGLDDYARHIAEVMTRWTAKKDFTSSGRTLYWHGPSGTAVWRNPRDADGGSAFRPPDGKKYFDRQIR